MREEQRTKIFSKKNISMSVAFTTDNYHICAAGMALRIAVLVGQSVSDPFILYTDLVLYY